MWNACAVVRQLTRKSVTGERETGREKARGRAAHMRKEKAGMMRMCARTLGGTRT